MPVYSENKWLFLTSKFKSAGLMIRVKILNNYLGPYPSDLSLHIFNLNFYYENHFYSFLVKHKCKAATIRLRSAQAGNHFPVRWLIFGSSTYRSKESLESQFLWKSIFQGHSRSPKTTKKADIGLIWVLIESSWIFQGHSWLKITGKRRGGEGIYEV